MCWQQRLVIHLTRICFWFVLTTGRIQISETTFALLKQSSEQLWERTQGVEVKGGCARQKERRRGRCHHQRDDSMVTQLQPPSRWGHTIIHSLLGYVEDHKVWLHWAGAYRAVQGGCAVRWAMMQSIKRCGLISTFKRLQTRHCATKTSITPRHPSLPTQPRAACTRNYSAITTFACSQSPHLLLLTSTADYFTQARASCTRTCCATTQP